MPGEKKLSSDLVDEALQWLLSGDAKASVNSSLRTLRKLTEHLEKQSFEGMKVQDLAKTATLLAKQIDEITRLLELLRGQPDQRTEISGLGDLLKFLTNDQFEKVSTWIDEGMKRLDGSENFPPA
jgi:hypothetical protein